MIRVWDKTAWISNVVFLSCVHSSVLLIRNKQSPKSCENGAALPSITYRVWSGRLYWHSLDNICAWIIIPYHSWLFSIPEYYSSLPELKSPSADMPLKVALLHPTFYVDIVTCSWSNFLPIVIFLCWQSMLLYMNRSTPSEEYTIWCIKHV